MSNEELFWEFVDINCTYRHLVPEIIEIKIVSLSILISILHAFGIFNENLNPRTYSKNNLLLNVEMVHLNQFKKKRTYKKQIHLFFTKFMDKQQEMSVSSNHRLFLLYFFFRCSIEKMSTYIRYIHLRHIYI